MTNRRHVLALGTALLLSGALGACAADGSIAGPVPEIGFQHLQPIRLDVSRVEVRSIYQSPMKAPHAEHRFPTPPARALTAWAKTRLRGVGAGSGSESEAESVATFTIEDASVIEAKLKKSTGLKGLFTYEPTERYDATVAARLTIESDRGRGEVRVAASRSVEVSENVTLAQREQAWFTMTEALMADFNTQMERQIADHLAGWRAAPNAK